MKLLAPMIMDVDPAKPPLGSHNAGGPFVSPSLTLSHANKKDRGFRHPHLEEA